VRPAWRAAAGLAIGVPVLLVLLWGIGALSVVEVVGVPQPPALTIWLVPFARLLRDICAALTIGLVLVGGVLADRPQVRLLRLGSIFALGWLLSLGLFIILSISEILAFPLAAALDPTVVWAFLTQTTLGQTMLVQVACVSATALLCWAVLGRPTGLIVLALAGVAATSVALTGHSGLHSGHQAASISLALHIAAASAWIGGLVAICILVVQSGWGAAVVLRRYSVVALACVIVLAESGLVNASLRLDGPAALVSSTYGAIVLAKATLLGWLVLLGWRQRTMVIRGFSAASGTGQDADPRQLLLRLALVELLVMGSAFALSVSLSRTAAPEGQLPDAAFSQGAVAAVALGIPLLLMRLIQPGRLVARLRSFPEISAVLLVIVMAVVSIGTTLQGALGAQWGASLGLALLVLAGLAFVMAIDRPGSVPAIAIVMAGWPVIFWLALRFEAQVWDPTGWLAVAVGEILLAFLAWRSVHYRQESRERGEAWASVG
jgi:putative copper resistance protein D